MRRLKSSQWNDKTVERDLLRRTPFGEVVTQLPIIMDLQQLRIMLRSLKRLEEVLVARMEAENHPIIGIDDSHPESEHNGAS